MADDLKFYQDLNNKLDGSIAIKTANKVSSQYKDKVLGAPNAIVGESIMGSRGLMLSKLYGALKGYIPREQAKIEFDFCERYAQKSVQAGFAAPEANSFMFPLGDEFLSVDHYDATFRHECKGMMAAGAGGDVNEMVWHAKKAFNYDQKTAQSFLDQTLGGSLVGPPVQGELINLARNKNACLSAGARVIPLPPSGQMEWPRETSASSVFHVGENVAGTETNINTGKLSLKGKKLIGLVRYPNELVRYATVNAETMFRHNLMESLMLQLDQDILYGAGSDNVINGLINVPNTQSVTLPGGTTMAPGDLSLFPSAIEENNGEMEAFIIRPQFFYKFVAARAAVYNGSSTSATGQFVFDQFRQLGQGASKVLAGFPAITTNQVSITRGGGSGTTLFAGKWSDLLVALFGSVIFDIATQGDVFAADQRLIRAILIGDASPQHPAWFVYADGISTTLGA